MSDMTTIYPDGRDDIYDDRDIDGAADFLDKPADELTDEEIEEFIRLKQYEEQNG